MQAKDVKAGDMFIFNGERYRRVRLTGGVTLPDSSPRIGTLCSWHVLAVDYQDGLHAFHPDNTVEDAEGPDEPETTSAEDVPNRYWQGEHKIGGRKYLTVCDSSSETCDEPVVLFPLRDDEEEDDIAFNRTQQAKAHDLTLLMNRCDVDGVDLISPLKAYRAQSEAETRGVALPWHAENVQAYGPCPDDLRPGGPTCPRCKGLRKRGATPDTWVHAEESAATDVLNRTAADVLKRLVYFHDTDDTPNSDPWIEARAVLNQLQGQPKLTARQGLPSADLRVHAGLISRALKSARTVEIVAENQQCKPNTHLVIIDHARDVIAVLENLERELNIMPTGGHTMEYPDNQS